MREDGEDPARTCSAIDPPDGDSHLAAHGYNASGEASTAATGRLVFELIVSGTSRRQGHTEKGFAITKQLHVGWFVFWESMVIVRFSRVWRAVLRMVTLWSDGRCR